MLQLLALSLFFLASAFAQESRPNLVISEILNHSEIKIAVYNQRLQEGEKLSIISQENGEVLGHVEVLEIGDEEMTAEGQANQWARASIIVHPKNAIPIVGDLLDKIDLSNASDRYPGRGDLLVFSGERWDQSNKKISARYRSLVDQGLLVGETAATLARNEHFINLASKYAFGLTDRLSASTVIAVDIAGVYNANMKYNAFRNEDFLVSPTLGFSHWAHEELHKSNLTFGLYVDVMTNSKLISHSALIWSVQGKFFGKKDPTQSYLTTSSIQSGYEYILDNWNRFLLGPRYYFDTQAVGGYLSYMMVWDRFHLQLGINSMNLSRFSFGKNGLLPIIDLFWRL